MHSLVKTFDGGYAITGFNQLVKTDDLGNVLWIQRFGQELYDRVYLLVEKSDEGYIIAGTTSSSGAGMEDFWLIKTDEEGIIPEFPSWIILPLFLAATLSAILFKKRILHQSS